MTAQVMSGRVEGRQAIHTGKISQIPDVFQPAAVLRRIGRHRKQRDKDIQQRGGDDGRHQHAEGFVFVEGKFLCRMRDILETDKRPGRNGSDPDDLPQRQPVFRHIGRREGDPLSPSCDAGNKADRDGCRKEYRHAQHAHGHHFSLMHTEKSDQDDRRDGQQRLPKVHIVSEKRIHSADMEYIPQEIAGKQRKRRGVGP